MKQNIYDELINNNIIDNVNRSFNVEINNNKVYNQKGSCVCWIYAAINLLSSELSKTFKNKMLDFSVNYISFFDRYEKMSLLYDKIINEDCEYSQVKYMLFDYVNPYGDFSSIKYLILKYGIVLEHQMPMVANNYIPDDINDLLKEKIINDIEIILQNKKDLHKLSILKEQMMKENYDILSNIFGKPPKSFDTKSVGINGSLTPLEFSNKYIKEILDNYIDIVSLSNLEYNKEYKLDFNVLTFNEAKYLNKSINEIKQYIINSLKDSSPVWFGCSLRYISGSYQNTNGVLCSDLYNFNKIGISKLDKKVAFKYDIENYDHAMLFTGVNIVNNKATAWKVLNSFGIENNYKGYFTMYNDFFDENVFMFAINKKYFK